MFQLSPGLAPEPLYRFQQEYIGAPPWGRLHGAVVRAPVLVPAALPGVNASQRALAAWRSAGAGGPVTTATPNSNFLKGVKWSPDGMCFITASDDNWCGEWLKGACCGAGPASSPVGFRGDGAGGAAPSWLCFV